MIFIKKYRTRSVFSIDLIQKSTGYILFKTNGDSFFIKEAGGHRFQRIPPTERNGRIQTSTVTVAVLDNTEKSEVELDYSKLIVEYYKAGGPGGQHKNKVETACQLKYGDVIVTCSDNRLKQRNYESAMKELKRRLVDEHNTKRHNNLNNTRKSQIGLGQRGDKIRTYRSKDNIAIDHRTGQKIALSNILKGVWFD